MRSSSVALAGIAAIFLVTGLAAAPAALADGTTTLYVDELSATCSDSGSGAQALPFCTLQAAADAAQPGDTIIVSVASGPAVPQRVTFTQSGTPSQPITIAWSGTGASPTFSGDGTGPVFTFDHVHDISVSQLRAAYGVSVDGVDVVGSRDITLDQLRLQGPGGSGAGPAEVSVDGSSSSITVSRSIIAGTTVTGAAAGIRVLPGAAGVTISTNRLVQQSAGTPLAVSGASGVSMTSNTVIAACGDVAVSAASSAVIENNLFSQVKTAACVPADAVAVSVDALSAATVDSDYNLFSSAVSGADYSWAGISYSDVPAFNAATSQGAHDTMMTSAGVPAGQSSFIDSADCAAPGELATDLAGEPHVDDPLVPNTGTGTCYADRGAIELQDALPAPTATIAPVASSVAAGITPVTATATITSATTSNFGFPISYAVNFGDGSAPVPAIAGAAGPVASHQYTTPGLYTVTTAAVDATGATGRGGTGQFYALSPQPVLGSLTATPHRVAASITPDAADFTAAFGADSWQVAQALLSFGDGTPAAFATSFSSNGDMGWSNHVYASPGSYTATLTITDWAGRVTTAQTAIIVGDQVKNFAAHRDFTTTIPAHAVAKITLLTLGVNSARGERGALVDLIVTNPRQDGTVVMYPDGTPRPSLATVRFRAGHSAANSALATGGATIDFYNSSNGSIGLDGYTYGIEAMTPLSTSIGSVGSHGATFIPVSPARVLPATKIPGAHHVAISAAGHFGVPANASAVVLDITSTTSAAAGNFVTWAEKGQPPFKLPGAYWSKGQPVTGLATVPVQGRVILSNNSTGTANFTADVVGYYTPIPATAGTFLPAVPHRLMQVQVAGKHWVKLTVAGQNGVPATGTTAVMVNLTASGATAAGTLTAYADGTGRPGITNLSYTTAGAEAATIAGVGADGAIDVYNSGLRPVTLTVDLTGSFYAYPAS